MFSIIIPTWNNLSYVQLCIRSIRQNSSFDHQIIVHVNDGSDGTARWIKEQGLDATFSPDNIGICHAVNQAAAMATQDYIVYMNDDMYCCPGWDVALLNQIKQLPSDLFMLSGTMIEPKESGNACVVVANYGDSETTFNEATLLKTLPKLKRSNWYGSTWPPTIVHRKWWFSVGGYSTEFSPGMSSDNDFAMKMWHAGCRHFMGVGDSLIYHFQCKSTGKVVKNDGRRQFLMKWGITQSAFDKLYLYRGQPASSATLPAARHGFQRKLAILKARIKIITSRSSVL